MKIKCCNIRPTILVPLILFVLSLAITLGFHGKGYDDAYITYRCAHNFAEGNGLIYNTGGNTSATTTPLLTIILGILGKITSPNWIPAWGGIISGLSLFALTLLIWMHAKREQQQAVAVIAVAWMFANPFLETVWGGESLMALALALGSFYLYFEKRVILAAILCFAAFMTRGEGVIPLIVMITHTLWKEKRIEWKMPVVVALLMVVWFFVARLLGTSFLPNTLTVKMAQMQSGVFGPFVKTTLDWYRAYIIGSPTFSGVQPQPILVVLPVLAGLGAFAWLLKPSERWGWIMLWLVLYVVGYSVLSVPFYAWYAFPIYFAGSLCAGMGHHFVEQSFGKLEPFSIWASNGIKWSYRALLLFALATAVYPIVKYSRAPLPQQQKLYTNAGLWLYNNTKETDTVGFFEIGFLGYYSERYMVDPVGLANSDVVPHMQERDFTWAFRNYKPDYIILSPVRWYDRIGCVQEKEWFKSQYELAASIEEPGYFDSPLSVYKKIR